jgi:hypothetical protein
MSTKLQAGTTTVQQTPEAEGRTSDVPGVHDEHAVKHVWLGEAVPLCDYDSVYNKAFHLRDVKYARDATCLFCIIKIQ